MMVVLRLAALVSLLACGPSGRNNGSHDAATGDAGSEVPLYPGSLRPGFHLPGLAGVWRGDVQISDLVLVSSPSGIVVGGMYRQAGDLAARPVLWNGGSWIALPTTDPYRIAVDSSGTLYSVQRQLGCDLCGPVSISRLHQGQWQTLPSSFYFVTTMAATGMGLVIVGDDVLYRFDGTNWIELGSASGGGYPHIQAIAERNGTLCIGGKFDAVESVPASNVACLTAGVWSQAGDGIIGTVRSLAFTSNGRLVAGGAFQTSRGRNLAVLDRGRWSAPGGGVDGVNAVVNVVAVDGDAIIAGGFFATPAPNLVRFVRGAWSAPSGNWFSVSGAATVTDLAVASDGVYVAGIFDRIGDVTVSHVARWTNAIQPVMPPGDSPLGISGSVRALLQDSPASIIAAGHFVAAGTMPASNVARMVNGTWQPLGAIAEPVSGLAKTSEGVFAATDTGSVLRWSGTSWNPIAPSLNGRVRALLEYNGELIVAGDFTSVGNHVVRWNGSQFVAMGAGLPWSVRALGNVRGELCAGLWIPDNLEDPEDRPLRCWNGSSWTVDGNLRGWDVSAITTLADNTVVVTGSLKFGSDYFGLAIHRTSWERFRIGQSGSALLPYGGGVFIAGHRSVTWWDGQSMEPLPTLVTGWSSNCLVMTPNGLFIGGDGLFSRDEYLGPFAVGVAAFDLQP